MRRASVLGRSVAGERTANVDTITVYGDNTPLVDADIEDLECATIKLGGVTVNAFSTDGVMSAPSDSKIPTEQAVSEYVVSSIHTSNLALHWLEPIESIFDNTPTPGPTDYVYPTNVAHVRYIALTTGGLWAINSIYEGTGTLNVWLKTTPTEGDILYNKTTNRVISYTGSVWVGVGTLIDHADLVNKGSLTHSTIDSYLDQSVKAAATPAFNGIVLGGQTCTAFSTDGVMAVPSDSKIPTEQAVTEYVASAIHTSHLNYSWLESVESIHNNTSGLPAATAHIRYIAQVTANTWTKDYVYEGNGIGWDGTTPVIGNIVSNKGTGRLISYTGIVTGWMDVGTAVDHADLINRGTLTHSTIDSYLDQSVKAAATPAFTGIVLGGQTCTAFSTDGVMSSPSDTRIPTEQAVTEYVASSLHTNNLEHNWLEPIESIFDNTPTPGPTDYVYPANVAHVRYIALTVGGLWATNSIFEGTGTVDVWLKTIPTEGYIVYNKATNRIIVFSGTAWVGIGTVTDHADLVNKGTLSHSTIDSYLDQSVKIAASPEFLATTVKTLTVRSVADPAKKMDMTVDANGDGVIDCSGNDLSFANTDVVHVLNPVGATSSTTGALQSLGGIGTKMSLHADGYVVGGAVGVSDLVTGATFKCSGRFGTTAEYTRADAGGTATTTGTVSISNGKISVPGGSSIYWPFDAKTASATVETWRFKYTPGYPVTPGATVEMLQVADNTYANYSILEHLSSTGNLSFRTVASSATVLNVTYGAYSAVSGTEDEFYVSFNLAAATARVWKNGIELTAAYIVQNAGSRGAVTKLRCNTSSAAMSIRDIALWNTVINPSSPYNPGYAVWPEVGAVNLRATDTSDAASSAPIKSAGGIFAAKSLICNGRSNTSGSRIEASTGTPSLVIEGYKSINADYTAGALGLTAVTTGTVAITNGKIALANAATMYIPIDTSNDAGQVGTIRMKYTPNYGGYPASVYQTIFSMKPITGNINVLSVYHATNGYLYMTGRDSGDVAIIGANIGGPFSCQAGREYEIEISWNFAVGSGAQLVFIDGELSSGSGTSTSVTGRGPTERLYILSASSDSASYRDIMLFRTVQHTASYTPGYSSWSSIDAPMARISGPLEVHGAATADWVDKMTMTVDANGDGTIDCSGNDLTLANTDVFRVGNTVDSTSKSTGAIIVYGGAAVADTLTAGAYVNATSMSVFDSLSGAKFRCSGRYSVNAEYTLADAGGVPALIGTTPPYISGGKILMPASSNIEWPFDTKIDSSTQTWSLKYTPGYNTSPAASVTMLRLATADAGEIAYLIHKVTTGLLAFLITTTGGGTIKLNVTFGTYTASSGVESEFYLTFSSNIATPTARLWKDGVELTATWIDRIQTTRTVATKLTSYVGGSTTYSLRDIAIWNSVIDPASTYTPGYTVWPEALIPNVLAIGTGDAGFAAVKIPSGGIQTGKGMVTSSRCMGAGLRVEEVTNAARTLAIEGYKSLNADYTAGSGGLVPTTSGTVAVTNGKIALAVGAYLYIPIDASNDGGQVGAIRMKYTPNYGGYPATTYQFLFKITSGAGGVNYIETYHGTAGYLYMSAKDSIDGTIRGGNIGGPFYCQAGREYEIEINWNFTVGSGAQSVFIDGELSPGSGTSTSVTGRGAGDKLYIQSAAANSSASYRDIILFNAVQHTASYKPGYVAISAIDAPLIRTAGPLEIHGSAAADWPDKATMGVDGDGLLTITPTGATGTKIVGPLEVTGAINGSIANLTGTSVPFTITSTSANQLTVAYDGTYKASVSVDNAGNVDFTSNGPVTFSQDLITDGNLRTRGNAVIRDALETREAHSAVNSYGHKKTTTAGTSPLSASFLAYLDSSTDADISAASHSPTSYSGSITNGKFPINVTEFLTYDLLAAETGMKGCISFRYTPLYSGTPAALVNIAYLVIKLTADDSNSIKITHVNGTGVLRALIVDSQNLEICDISAVWDPDTGVEYLIELNWELNGDLVNGTVRLFVDGAVHASSTTITGVRLAADELSISTSNGSFMVRDIAIWNEPQHTAAYNMGYQEMGSVSCDELSAREIRLTRPHWDDLNAFLSFKIPGVSADGPTMETFVTIGGITIETVAYTNNKWSFFSIQMPHTWDAGTEIIPHMHWAPHTSMGLLTARFYLDWEIRAIGDAYTGTGQAYTSDITLLPETTVNKHVVSAFASATPSSITTPSAVIVGKLRRGTIVQEGDAGASYGDPIFLLGFDFHIQKSRVLGDYL